MICMSKLDCENPLKNCDFIIVILKSGANSENTKTLNLQKCVKMHYLNEFSTDFSFDMEKRLW